MKSSIRKIAPLPLLVLLALGLNGNPDLIHAQEAEKISGASDQDASAGENADAKSTQFLRIKRDDDGKPLSLQTSIVRYRNSDRTLLVDLIGAVHIGEAAYYKKLNHQFDQYEALLYELVAPQGTRVPQGGGTDRSNNPISFLQSSAQSMLGLESQLELIDYQKENFVHADLSPEEMQAKMAERGDTVLTVGLSALADMLRQQNLTQQANARRGESNNALDANNLFEVMGDPLQMKRMMAEQFSNSGVMEMGLGTKLNQLIVTDRNEAAMRVLQRQVVDGKTKLALFYGAAHMPDFEKRFEDLGLVKSEQVWVDAWDLTTSNAKSANSTSKLLMQLLKSLDDN